MDPQLFDAARIAECQAWNGESNWYASFTHHEMIEMALRWPATSPAVNVLYLPEPAKHREPALGLE
jgi:hypothetical protein